MRKETSLCLLPHSAVFKNGATYFSQFFSETDAKLLYSTLILNYLEVITPVEEQVELFVICDKNDLTYLPEDLEQIKNKLLFTDVNDKASMFKSLNEKIFSGYKNNLLIFSNTIGVKPSDIKKATEFLSIDDETVVLGKSISGRVVFFGFNTYYPSIAENIETSAKDFSQMLLQACKQDNYLQVFGNFISVDDLNDFKDLYRELSRRESISYCSTKMHERFTHLFVEYKDLLK